jgi:hypothetical protein
VLEGVVEQLVAMSAQEGEETTCALQALADHLLATSELDGKRPAAFGRGMRGHPLY